jgi:non-specific serine/threonine protein kinase
MKCPKCQTVNPDDSKFCKECAAPLMKVKGVSFTVTLKAPRAGFSKGTVIADKYKIIEEIGRGGMGVVYKAKDTRLDRTVALKFLSSELTQDKEAKQRFVQEAKAAAALNHPNISIIHEIDEHQGKTFIAMEFIQGHSLKERLEERPLEIDEAKDIALQIAEGLKEAHTKGIIHRDIKPANIMLTDKGQAKITDFGLAKLSGGADLTKASTVMGTVAYMSPEQAKGEDVDHRTDIWSLGAIIYEILSGERPFQKAQEQALIYSILNDKPTPLSLIRSDVPSHIEQVIEKALAKKQRERYQDIPELIKDLNLSVALPMAEKSIVVLPFDDMSPGKDSEYFSDGLTEEIISDLSLIHGLLVISKSSAMTYKGTKKKIKEIGKELNIQYVLEGSVRKAGNNLRITAQLIDAINDVHLWAKKYSGTLDDVFDIQERVSRSIVDALKVKLSSEENKKIAERAVDNVHAYDCLMRARQEIWKYTEDSLQRALQYLKNGLNITGENVLIYAGIGLVYFQYYDTGISTDEDNLKKAEEYAYKIFDIDPDSSHAHRLLGLLKIKRENIKEAYKHFKRAYEIDPNDPDTIIWTSSCIALYFGKPFIAMPIVQRALKIDPLTPINHWLPGVVYWAEGKFEKALESVLKYQQMEPESLIARWYSAMLLAWNEQFDEAYEFMDQLEKDAPKHMLGVQISFFKNALQGKKEKALNSLTKNIRTSFWNDFHMPWHISECFALIDEKEESLDWLEQVINKGFCNYPLFSKLDPFLENIRGEPRFKELMERVKHEWENFEV